jgi:hypothetical protein
MKHGFTFTWRVLTIPLAAIMLTGCGQRVSSWQEEKIAELNTKLLNAEHPLRLRVQDRHLTVTVKEAKVTHFEAKTKHDLGWTGWDGCNLETCTFDVTFTWDGVLHKGGKTVLRIVMLPLNNEVSTVEVIRTDAAINLGDNDTWKSLSKEIQDLFGSAEGE